MLFPLDTTSYTISSRVHDRPELLNKIPELCIVQLFIYNICKKIKVTKLIHVGNKITFLSFVITLNKAHLPIFTKFTHVKEC